MCLDKKFDTLYSMQIFKTPEINLRSRRRQTSEDQMTISSVKSCNTKTSFHKFLATIIFEFLGLMINFLFIRTMRAYSSHKSRGLWVSDIYISRSMFASTILRCGPVSHANFCTALAIRCENRQNEKRVGRRSEKGGLLFRQQIHEDIGSNIYSLTHRAPTVAKGKTRRKETDGVRWDARTNIGCDSSTHDTQSVSQRRQLTERPRKPMLVLYLSNRRFDFPGAVEVQQKNRKRALSEGMILF